MTCIHRHIHVSVTMCVVQLVSRVQRFVHPGTAAAGFLMTEGLVLAVESTSVFFSSLSFCNAFLTSA